MPRDRLFDWDEARRLYAEGESQKALALRYGVTPGAIHHVVKGSGYCPCPRCGEPMRYSATRCRACADAEAVREDTLLCCSCGEWKPDAAFSPATARKARRGRHKECRDCGTRRKREWRRDHPGREARTARIRRQAKVAA